MEISILHPYYALLLLVLPLLWLRRFKPKSSAHLAIRTLLLACIIIALTQPVLLRQAETVYQVIVLDQTDSMSAEQKLRGLTLAQGIVDQADSEDKLTLVQLGGEPVNLTEQHIQLAYAQLSSLPTALSQAIGSIPLGMKGAVTLISDGMSTDQHWSKVLGHLKSRNIPVHTYQLQSSTDLFLASFRTERTRVGEDMNAFVEVVGNGRNLQVVVRNQTGEELTRSAVFNSDGRHIINLDWSTESAGHHQYQAELLVPNEQNDKPDNNRLSTFVAIQPALQVLYLGDRQNKAELQLQTLLGKGFELVTEPLANLDGNFDFSQFDVVIQDDLPLAKFGTAAQQNLIDAVQNQGVGLLHTGGEAAFGAGGYFDTAMGALLPVDMEQNEQKTDPSVALAIILDTSGSMAGTRIELARNLARIAVRQLKPHDRIGIVEFYGAKHWAIPMQPATNKIEIERAIGRMKAIGGTVLYPAIEEAYFGVKALNTKHKHIVVITDAGIEDSDYENMLRRIAKDNINVSTVLVGPGGHNQIMANMANWGKGRFYSVANEFSLVEMILKQPSTKKMPAYERGDFSLGSQYGQGWWHDVDTSAMPSLTGYAKVSERQGAETLLFEQSAKTPVMTTWQYGLGRVTAFMSEPVGYGTENWQNWPEYGQWLGRVIAKTAGATSNFSLDVKRQGDRIYLSVDRLSTNSQLVPQIQILDEQGQVTDSQISLVERAPGMYTASFDWPNAKNLNLAVTSGQSQVQYLADIAASDVTPEAQVDPVKTMTLASLSELTSGQVIGESTTSKVALADSKGQYGYVVNKLWPYLLLFALVLYFLDLVTRRFPSRRVVA